MDKLQSYTNDLTVHASKCTGNVTLVEQERDGLASVLLGECSHCDESIAFETSAKIKGPHGYSRWETNLASVLGSNGYWRRTYPVGRDNEYNWSACNE